MYYVRAIQDIDIYGINDGMSDADDKYVLKDKVYKVYLHPKSLKAFILTEFDQVMYIEPDKDSFLLIGAEEMLLKYVNGLVEEL